MANSEMVERVAKVLERMTDSPPATYEELACAAIAAMREPTEAMCDAGANDRPGRQQSYADVWRAMIDAALKD